MSYLTPKAALIFGLVLIPHTAMALTPCKSGLSAIDIVEGTSNPPGYLKPDTESLGKGKWPANLIEQGWHNLRKAERPLTLVCRYANGGSETIRLPDTIDTCILKPGLVVTCQ